jgi:hypothetical protein
MNVQKQYCRPSAKTIEYEWNNQKTKKRLNMRAHGMDDQAFKALFDLIFNDTSKKAKHIDLTYNSLTNATASKLYKLFTELKITVDIRHNRFDLEKIEDIDLRNFIIQNIQVSAALQMVCQSLNMNRIERAEAISLETADRLNNISAEINVLVRSHTNTFDKINRQIEKNIAYCFIKQFESEGYSFITEDIPGYEKETDLFLISGDGSKVVIGEAEHDMTNHAFGRVEERKRDFISIHRSKLPERLQNWTTVILLVGADTCKENLHKKAENRGLWNTLCIANGIYTVEDYSGKC